MYEKIWKIINGSEVIIIKAKEDDLREIMGKYFPRNMNYSVAKKDDKVGARIYEYVNGILV